MGRVFARVTRNLMLERVLDRYVAEGWTIDDRFDGCAVISLERGAGYVMLGLRGMLKDEDGRPPERHFKLKDVRVDKFGNVDVSKAPSRGEKASRYRSSGPARL